MTFQQELRSWLSPSPTSNPVSPAPDIGKKAPSDEKLLIPPKDGKSVIVTFLRHCGCPFAEKTFLSLRSLASTHKGTSFIALSHSSPTDTERWLSSVGGEGDVSVIVDDQREVYAQWGLGTSSAWHVLNPWSMWNVYVIGKEDKIWNRPTESGNRWQTAGSWAVDNEGTVRWGGVSKTADDVPDFEEGVRAIA